MECDEGLSQIVRELPPSIERIEVRWGADGWEYRLGRKRPREEAGAAEPLLVDDQEEEHMAQAHKALPAAGGKTANGAQCRVKVEGAT